MVKQNEESDKPVNSTMKYASLATQWMVMLGLAVWAGINLDQKLHLKVGFVILFPVISLGFSLWMIVKDFSKQK